MNALITTFWTAWVIITAILVFIAVSEANNNDIIFNELTNFIDTFSFIKDLVWKNPKFTSNVLITSFVSALSCLFLFNSKLKSYLPAVLICFSLSFLFYINDQPIFGHICILIGIFLLVPQRIVYDSRTIYSQLTYYDAVLIAVLTSLSGTILLYELNTIPQAFEGELSPYSLGASNIQGMFYANYGIPEPFAPLGFLYYIPIFISTKLVGQTVLSIRLGSCLVSLLTLPLLYLLTKRLSSTVGAVCASLLFILEDLQIGWGRTDVHPHAATSWITISLILSILNFIEKRGYLSATYIVFLGALSFHQYPSGQTAVFLPFLVILISAFTPQVRNQLPFTQLIFLSLFGFAIWVVGLLAHGYFSIDVISPFPYFKELDSRVYGQNTSGFTIQGIPTLLQHYLHSINVFVSSFFISASKIFHQEILITYPGLPVRYITWFSVTTALTSLIYLTLKERSIRAIILISWLVVAITPTIFSEYPYAKRASTLFPLMFILSGITVSHLCSSLSNCRKYLIGFLILLSTLYYLFQLSAWFLSDHFKQGEVKEERFAAVISRHVEKNTLILFHGWDSYAFNKFSFVISPYLLNSLKLPSLLCEIKSPISIINKEAIESTVQDCLQRPPLLYLWGPNRDNIDFIRENFKPKRIILIIQRGPEAPSTMEIYSNFVSKEQDISKLIFDGKGSVRAYYDYFVRETEQ